jgi:hypothetical protein
VVDNIGELESWFEDVAQWWQRPISELSTKLYFTHGMRIHHYKTSEDQLEFARKAIASQADEDNGKAIICLIDPESDFHVDKNRLAGWFPAFSMAQFYVTRYADGQKRVNITGIYRKQEMRYWWAINVRELRILLEKLDLTDLPIGSITTIATIAIAGDSKPRVAIPILDRWYDVEKALIADHVQAFVEAAQKVGGRIAKADEKLRVWREILADLVPPPPDRAGRLDNVPVATSGLELVVTLLTAQVAYRGKKNLRAFLERLKRVRDQQMELRNLIGASEGSNAEKKQRYERIYSAISAEIGLAISLVEKAFGSR